MRMMISVLLLVGCAAEPQEPCMEWRERYVNEVKRVAGYEIAYQSREWYCAERAKQ